MTDVKSMLSENAEITEKYIESIFEKGLCGNNNLTESSKYSILGGGKRIRASLVLEFCRLFGGDDKASLPFAAAIEMIHAFSLVHDDMPCMDNDDMRRGKPSCHKKYGEGQALLCGDELLCLAFEVMISNDNVSASTVKRVVKEFAVCSGALGMMGGQQYDLFETPSNWDELVRLHKMKTGALICASSLVGYYAATENPDSDTVEKIKTYAYNIGLAFQITDDILDEIADEKILGKPVKSDEKNGKITSLTFMTIEEAITEAKRLTDEAIDAISSFEGSERLCSLAEFLLNRSF